MEIIFILFFIWGRHLWAGRGEDSFKYEGHSMGTGVGLFQLRLVHVAGPSGRGLHRRRGGRASVRLETRGREDRVQCPSRVLNRVRIVSELFDCRMEGVQQGSVSDSGSSVTLDGFQTWRQIFFVSTTFL